MRYRFNFTGRQANAIGITSDIWDNYDNIKSLGEAMYKLYTDYELISHLQCWDISNKGAADCWDSNKIDPTVLSNTKLIKSKYPKRETSPNTGTYRYNRYDAPKDYKW